MSNLDKISVNGTEYGIAGGGGGLYLHNIIINIGTSYYATFSLLSSSSIPITSYEQFYNFLPNTTINLYIAISGYCLYAANQGYITSFQKEDNGTYTYVNINFMAYSGSQQVRLSASTLQTYTDTVIEL